MLGEDSCQAIGGAQRIGIFRAQNALPVGEHRFIFFLRLRVFAFIIERYTYLYLRYKQTPDGFVQGVRDSLMRGDFAQAERWALQTQTPLSRIVARGCQIMQRGGSEEEVQARVFDPYFTTRRAGNGFGLHSAALAAKELGGSLAVHSDGPGKGATFTLCLPVK